MKAKDLLIGNIYVTDINDDRLLYIGYYHGNNVFLDVTTSATSFDPQWVQFGAEDEYSHLKLAEINSANAYLEGYNEAIDEIKAKLDNFYLKPYERR